MTVNLYDGVPGSGKSLNVTRKILEALMMGRDVISNYSIKFLPREVKKGYPDHFFYVDDEYISVLNLAKFAKARGYLAKRKESLCLVVIDEAGIRFNTRSDKEEKNMLEEFLNDDAITQVKVYGKKDRSQWVKFFSQHRKFGYDFILVAQSDRMLDRQIRDMIELQFSHRKAASMYWWFKLFPFKTFITIERYFGTNLKTGSEFFCYHKSLGARYDSMKLFDGYDMSVLIESDADCRAIFSSG